MTTPGEERAAAEFRVRARVQHIVAEARADLANSLAAQHLGDDGEEWLRRCYLRLEALSVAELRYAVVLALSGRAELDARALLAGGRPSP